MKYSARFSIRGFSLPVVLVVVFVSALVLFLTLRYFNVSLFSYFKDSKSSKSSAFVGGTQNAQEVTYTRVAPIGIVGIVPDEIYESFKDGPSNQRVMDYLRNIGSKKDSLLVNAGYQDFSDGTYKYHSWVYTELHKLNSDIVLLEYANPMNYAGNVFYTNLPDEGYYLHEPYNDLKQTSRLVSPFYRVDPTPGAYNEWAYDRGNPGFQQFFAQKVVDAIKAGADGIWMDNSSGSCTYMGECSLLRLSDGKAIVPTNPRTGKTYTSTEYHNDVKGIAAVVRQALNREFPNGTSTNNVPIEIFSNAGKIAYYQQNDENMTWETVDQWQGVLTEGHWFAQEGYKDSGFSTFYENWIEQQKAMKEVLRRGYPFIFLGWPWKGDQGWDWPGKNRALFTYASLLLCGGGPNDKVFMRYTNGDAFDNWGAFDQDIGRPTGDSYVFPGTTNVYARRFSKALVLVNPTDKSVTLNPGFSYRPFVDYSDSYGNDQMDWRGLGSQTSAQVTLNPLEAAILVTDAVAATPVPTSAPTSTPAPTAVVTPPPSGTSGKSALRFTADAQSVNLGTPSSLNTVNAVTVEAWVKPESLHNGMVYSHAWTNADNQNFALGVGDDQKLYWILGNGSTYLETGGPTSYKLNDWNHIALTWDNSSKMFKTYLNGNLDKQGSFSGPLSFGDSPALIGKTDWGYGFKGSIDEVRVWNYSRTQQQLQSSMNSEIDPASSGLVGYWRFNENSGVTLNDLTSNRNNGTVSGALWVSGYPFTTSAPTVTPTLAPTATPTPVPTPVPTSVPVPPTSGSKVDIVALGSQVGGVYPVMELRVNNGSGTWTTVKSWNVTGSSATYSYTHPTKLSIENLRVYFTNDVVLTNSQGVREDRNLVVYRLTLDNTTYNSTNQATYSLGSWDSLAKCNGGYKRSDTLSCNGYFQYAGGPVNRSILFNGSGYIDLKTPSQLNTTNAVTVEGWIKPTKLHEGMMYVRDWYNAGNQHLALGVSSSQRLYLALGNGTSFIEPTGNLTYTLNAWNHIALTFDSATSTYKLYLNGNLDKQGTFSGPLKFGTASANIGKAPWGFNFSGGVDEVRIWNYARTQQQIKDSMYSEINPASSGLVGYWKLNEGISLTVTDSTASKLAGSVVNGTWINSGFNN